MYTFDDVDRNYAAACKSFSHQLPEHFNFAFDVIDARARQADKTAIITVSSDGSETGELRYSDLSEQSSRFANALTELGLTRGDFACVVIGRVPAWYHVLFGCMKVGVVSMPGTNLLTAKDIEYRVKESGAKAIIVARQHCEKIDSIRDNCPTLRHFIVTGDSTNLPSHWLSLEVLCAAASPTIKSPIKTRFDEMMMAYFTSGTTALPKMVPRDFGYGLAHAATGLFWMDLQESDIHWTLTDTGWAKAAWGMLFPQFLLGVTLLLHDAEGFDVDLHLRLIKRFKVTTFCAPPTIYRLFAQQNLADHDLSSLRRSLSAGEPLNPEVIRYWREHTGNTIADGYGQTETINIVGNFPDEPVKTGSMGRPVPGLDVDIIDDDGNRAPDGEIGHIAMRLPQNDGEPWPPGLFRGYLVDGQLDTKTMRNGWYYSGDTATRDKDGYFWFIGRADDLISSAGYRISPFEVESALLEHPAVAESAVVGEKDEIRGQIVTAYITLAKGFSPNDTLTKEIQDFCKAQTAPYKYPRVVHFVDALPKTISGKIRRVELRDKAAK